MAMGNGPFIDGLPIKNADFPWQTVSHNQMVTHMASTEMWDEATLPATSQMATTIPDAVCNVHPLSNGFFSTSEYLAGKEWPVATRGKVHFESGCDDARF